MSETSLFAAPWQNQEVMARFRHAAPLVLAKKVGQSRKYEEVDGQIIVAAI
jgi:hypothetical protein